MRARAEKPGLIGRSCGPFARELDRLEAYECGRAAVLAAKAGETEVMVALRRDSDRRTEQPFLTPLETVARRERPLPADWIAEDGNDVTGGVPGAMPLRWLGRSMATDRCGKQPIRSAVTCDISKRASKQRKALQRICARVPSSRVSHRSRSLEVPAGSSSSAKSRAIGHNLFPEIHALDSSTGKPGERLHHREPEIFAARRKHENVGGVKSAEAKLGFIEKSGPNDSVVDVQAGGQPPEWPAEASVPARP